MYRRNYPLLCAFLALAVWMSLDCQSQATPGDLASALTPATPLPEDLTEEQKQLIELLQTDGMAVLVCYAGYVIVTPPTGVTELPKDDTGSGGGGDPKDDTGNPPGPVDETPDPPDEPPADTPEPTSIVLGLIGLSASSVAYVRRRRRETSEPVS